MSGHLAGGGNSCHYRFIRVGLCIGGPRNRSQIARILKISPPTPFPVNIEGRVSLPSRILSSDDVTHGGDAAARAT